LGKQIHRKVPIDTGPPERSQHNTVVIERDVNNRPRLRVVDQVEIDRLLLQRKITVDQHIAGEHLFRDLNDAGYLGTYSWSLESCVRGDPCSISSRRANALLRVGFAKMWLNAKAGPLTTRLLIAVLIGERRVIDRHLPSIRVALDKYQSFESWWHNEPQGLTIPELLLDLPAHIQSHRPRSFHDQIS
jgi:hypothetical protein